MATQEFQNGCHDIRKEDRNSKRPKNREETPRLVVPNILNLKLKKEKPQYERAAEYK